VATAQVLRVVPRRLVAAGTRAAPPRHPSVRAWLETVQALCGRGPSSS